METEETRQLVQRFVEARAANDADRLSELLAEDAVWQPPASLGLGPFRGRDQVTKALTGGAVGKFLDVSTIERTVRKMVVEGDTAVVQQQLRARTVGGHEYVNDYCWVYRCGPDGITRLDEYADSLHAARLFGLVPS